MPEAERKVFDRIENNSSFRVRDVTDEVFQGLATSADKVYIGHIIEEVDEDTVRFQPTGSDESSIIEKSILEKLLKGSEIKRWKVDWQGLWLVFPYDDSGNVLSQQSLQNDYPHAWEFFKEYEGELKGRESGRMRGEPDWYGYIYPKNLTKFDSAKIMLGVLRQEPSFVPDPKGIYYFVGGGTAGGYGLHVMDEYIETEDDLLYYAGILNSRVLEFYHKHISFIFNSKYYSYGKTFVEPHPLADTENEVKCGVIGKAQEVKARYDEVAELGYKVSDIRNYIIDYADAQTVLDLADSIDLDDDDYRQDPIRKNDKMEVDTRKVYQVVMKRGHTLDFENERVRDFVYDLLKAQDRRLGRSEILNTEVPKKDDVLELMKEYRADEEEIDELEGEAEELQEELDEIILRDVYELDDSDIEVIDEFLEVW